MNIFFALSLIIVIATMVAAVLKVLKQPLVIAYILTGLLVAPLIHSYPESGHLIETFSEMGIAILLFIVGLHLSPEEAGDFGKAAFKIGVGQILFTSSLGFGLALLLGFSWVPALYIATALTFSSTIIVLKLLSDKNELEKLYGRIAIGVLLLQDIVAAIALIIASSFASPNVSALTVLFPLVKGATLTAVIFVISTKLLPKLTDFFATSTELLFLFSLAWGFGLASLFSYLGLSMEIGALIAGVALSVSPYASEISGKLRSLRDFFVVMFFILIGSQIDISQISSIAVALVILTIFIVVIKPLILMFLMGSIGYKKKTSFKGATSLAQISEFSLILGLLGLKLGHIDTSTMSLLTLLAVISIGLSSYLIVYADKIYSVISRFLTIFEKKSPLQETDIISSYDVVLFGCNRAGYDFIETFGHLGQSFVCVDYDPDITRELMEGNINSKYGDVEDMDFLDDLNLDSAKMVVSTIPDFEANVSLLKHIKNHDGVITIVLAHRMEKALKLYELGADYVILPHFIGGRLVAELAEKAKFDFNIFEKERAEHMEYLKERLELGHNHPGNLTRFEV